MSLMAGEAAKNEHTWIEGRISVESAIRGHNREVQAVYVRSGKFERSLRGLRKMARDAGIPFEEAGDEFFAANAHGQSHGGVLARVGPRRYSELAELADVETRPFVVMLDGIEDPFNFGQAVRALYAAGASGLVVRPRSWLSAAAVVTRASAGASELLPTAVCESALAAAEFFRARGLAIACTARKSAVSIYETDLTQPLFLLIGGEKRGITRSFLDQADLLLRIPYGRSFPRSLGAAASTAVIAFEVLRQRSARESGLPDAAEETF
ncbi:MAG: TrmH family RNA methyltransferase [Candidatus Promineifilaceae bacterium]